MYVCEVTFDILAPYCVTFNIVLFTALKTSRVVSNIGIIAIFSTFFRLFFRFFCGFLRIFVLICANFVFEMDDLWSDSDVDPYATDDDDEEYVPQAEAPASDQAYHPLSTI